MPNLSSLGRLGQLRWHAVHLRILTLSMGVCALALMNACVLDWTDHAMGRSPVEDAGGDGEGSPDGGVLDANTHASEEDGGMPRPEPAPGCGAAGECAAHSTCEALSQTCQCDDSYVRRDGECIADLCHASHAGPNCGEREICRVEGQAASCVCASGYEDCDGTCVDLQGDPMHCGSCELTCAAGLACEAGHCQQRAHALVVDEDVSCALLETGESSFPLRCWGDPANAFFRDGVLDDAVEPKSVTGVPAVRDLSITRYRRCAILPNEDKVRCWGRCGKDCGLSADSNSDATQYATFRDVAIGGITQVTTGAGLAGWGGNTCSLTQTTVECWGKAGMITDSIDRPQGTWTGIGESDMASFKTLAGNMLHNCGVLTDGTVGCWGNNGFGQLGVDKASVSATTTAGVKVLREGGGELSSMKMVDVEYARSCGVSNAGKVYCWGDNQLAFLGHGDEDAHVGAVEVQGISDATHVTLGGSATCVLVASGQVYCWGYKNHLGIGTEPTGDLNNGLYFSAPQRVPGLEHTLEVECGLGNCCARVNTGAVMCWGNNDHGQIGDGTKISRFVPTPVNLE